MNIKIVDTQNGLEQLEKPWNELAAQCSKLSLYSSYDYNRIAWKHFSGPQDRLFVLTLYDGAELKAIAPFYITRQRICHIPVRTIEFIATWEGDKPSIIAPASEEAAWNAICSFLSSEYCEWDILKIVEQPHGSTLLSRCAFLRDKSFFCQITHDCTSYYVDLTKTWEAYFSTRTSQQKKNWRRRFRKIESIEGGASVETISHPEYVAEALDRFVVLEKQSWKGGARIGVHSSQSFRLFYTEFSRLLAEKGQLFILFLKVGDEDVAGTLSYLYRDVMYSRNTAYNSKYAKFSPGIYLLVHQLQRLFGKGLREYDMMGMHSNNGALVDSKIERASGVRETEQLLVFNKKLKLLPVIWGKRIKGRLKGSVTATV